MSRIVHSGWRDPILAHFAPELASAARLTIVGDSDHLLTEQGVLDGIRQRGFELITFEDHVVFRYAFESRYRQLWDRDEETHLVVVLRIARPDVAGLPYDLLEQARSRSRLLSFDIGALFPNLAPGVVAALDRAEFDVLYEAQQRHCPDPLGENGTKDFILRHVFDIARELIRAPSDLLNVLLRRHYRARPVPSVFDDRFLHLLDQDDRWTDWPLRQIVPDRIAFLAFLAERWPLFIARKLAVTGGEAVEPRPSYGLRMAGPEALPFDHEDVRIYIDNLFMEGLLQPVHTVPKAAVAGMWLAVGVAGDERSDALDRLRRLLLRVVEELSAAGAAHGDWVRIAHHWAEVTALRWRLPPDQTAPLRDELETVHEQLESAFSKWMLAHYASLHNLSHWPKPVMVHHVLRHLAHTFDPGGRGRAMHRCAVVVVDGLALDQWVHLREDLTDQGGMVTEEGAVFAWVPTLTSVSRQAIFAGEPPFYFAPSIDGTYKEEQHWRRFWEDQGLQRGEIAYVCQKKQEGDDTFTERVRELAEHPRCRMLGVIVGTVDQTMHGTVMGTGGLHAAIVHWAKTGAFRRLIQALHGCGFNVFLTADHGNIEGAGMGKPDVGVVADERGQRVHVFRDELSRDRVHRLHTGTIIWPQVGLPEDYRALLAPLRSAFLEEGKRAVAHGGISMEEVIVPFVRVLERV